MAVRKALADVSLADIAMSAPVFQEPARPLSSRHPPATKAHR
jgi:hypothetical protein